MRFTVLVVASCLSFGFFIRNTRAGVMTEIITWSMEIKERAKTLLTKSGDLEAKELKTELQHLNQIVEKLKKFLFRSQNPPATLRKNLDKIQPIINQIKKRVIDNIFFGVSVLSSL
uniref:Cortactin-binding protein 2 n=1 Tax=Lygus hesperus TaxID=30085 RepID=A0A0A9VU17_LYGHE